MIDKLTFMCYNSNKSNKRNLIMQDKKELKNVSLPYYVTVESINKLIDATKKKQGDEVAIKTLFGEGKYSNCKSALLLFNIITPTMQFTEFGKSIAYAIDENQKKNAWRTVISKIAAYDDFINYFLLNKKGISTCEIDTIKNFWGSKDICKSDTMRKDASITFGYILSLAGLGEFKKGKQNTSRIEFYLEEVKKYCDNDDTSSGFNLAQTENNLIKSITSQNTENNQVNIPDHSNSLLIPKQIKQSNINVNISINVASIEELQKIMEYLKNV